MNFKFNKNYFLLFIYSFFILFISIFVASKPHDLDPDYYVYYNGFYYNENKEVSFNIIRDFLKKNELELFYLFFIYCFLSLFLKFKVFLFEVKRIGVFSFFFILFIYLFCFFPLWDVTQIRSSLALSFFLVAVVENKNRYMFFYLFLSILFHYGFLFICVIYLIVLYFRNIIMTFISTFILLLIFNLIVINTRYISYNDYEFGETFNPISLKNLFVFFVSLFVAFSRYSKDIRVRNIAIFNLNFLFFTCILGMEFASLAMRYADILLFLCFFNIAIIKEDFLSNLLKFFSLVVFIPFYIYVNFYSNNKLFDIDYFMELFLW